MTTSAAAKVYTVSELNEIVRETIERDARLRQCYVTGEISNFKHHSSGHMYFTLKDEKSRLRAIMFVSRARNLVFVPKDGMRVIVRGTLSVFDRDGQYQIYADDMQPDGVGALYVAFTQLRERLEREGLFQPERKKSLPKFPRCIGVVTSPTGAVIRDICSTLSRRYPLAKVVLSPASVQGPTAAVTIVGALERLSAWSASEPIDVIIIARGGGSLEELWPFNEEVVARAVAECRIPVVSAVGHETDFTICDFVADVRAATPTAAAELVAPYVRDLHAALDQWRTRAESATRFRLSEQRRRLVQIGQAAVLRHPHNIVNIFRQQVDYLDSQLQQHATKPVRVWQRAVSNLTERLYRVDISSRIATARNRLDAQGHRVRHVMHKQMADANGSLEKTIGKLEALNPLGVLRRGYSVLYKHDGTSVVSSVFEVRPGDRVQIRVSDGTIGARIESGGEQDRDGAIQSRLDI